ncbi:DUF928 domain-containing protein [Pseudanabaenaceae cyanobacterium LEGE 13415]|nr:DUF928 domain-containing protein [Pseudanabaenaceae cyanobacterium LEGE 13415]
MRIIRLGFVIAIATGLSVSAFVEAGFAQRFVPKNRGLPGRREGSGTRGACLQTQRSVVAIMPQSNSGLTVSAYPTFSWYVPATQPTTAAFVLLDDRQTELYSTTFQIAGKPGLISLSLPQTANLPPLEVGKTYRWKFSLTCDVDDPSTNMITEGWIQRVELATVLKNQLQSASLLDQAKLYAREGLWYDAVAIFLMLRRTQPSNAAIVNDWKVFLNSVALDDFSQLK